MKKFGGRKFVGFIFISSLLFTLAVLGKLNITDFLTFVTVNYAAFAGTNAIEHMTKGN